jgi:hypothetical protein
MFGGGDMFGMGAMGGMGAGGMAAGFGGMPGNPMMGMPGMSGPNGMGPAGFMFPGMDPSTFSFNLPGMVGPGMSAGGTGTGAGMSDLDPAAALAGAGIVDGVLASGAMGGDEMEEGGDEGAHQDGMGMEDGGELGDEEGGLGEGDDDELGPGVGLGDDGRGPGGSEDPDQLIDGSDRGLGEDGGRADGEAGLGKSKGGASGTARSGAGTKRDHAQIAALGRGLEGVVGAAGDPAAKKNRRVPPKDIKPCNENKVCELLVVVVHSHELLTMQHRSFKCITLKFDQPSTILVLSVLTAVKLNQPSTLLVLSVLTDCLRTTFWQHYT